MFIYIKKDCATSLPGIKYDKEIASKIKKSLDNDPELNLPSVTNSKLFY